jgi:phosphate transport system substrate-binding protein
MKRFSFFQLMLVILVLAATYSPAFSGSLDPFKDEKGVLKISGGTAHIPVMKEVAQKIMAMNPDIQIGKSGRKPCNEENKRYQLTLHQWAIDGVAPVVNPKNPVKNLTKNQVVDIFSGKIDNWKMLGGENRKIDIYTRDAASGTREVFWKKALDQGLITSGAHVVVSNGAMKSAIAQDPYGIGYVSVGHIDKTVAPVALDGVVPSIRTVQEGTYKIARGLYSNTKGEPVGLTRKFIDFLYTPDGKKIIEKHGFIPVR